MVVLFREAVVTGLRDRPSREAVVGQMHEVGVRSLSIVNLTAVFTGMVSRGGPVSLIEWSRPTA